MGCGCKKKKSQAAAAQTAQARSMGQPTNAGEPNVTQVQENKEYHIKFCFG